MNVIIPIAGSGSRFEKVGYTVPKPLIDVNGMTMIESVIKNLNLTARFIFIIQKKHDLEFELSNELRKILPDCEIVIVDGLTEGPACSVLLAKEYIDENPLIVINCDQMIHDFNINHLIEFSNVHELDGILGAFISSSNKNSYVKLNENGIVTEVREKIVISNIATNGLHYWVNGKDFVESAEDMIKDNERYNNEFYIAPTYNHLIKKGKKIMPFFYNLHYPIGTPDDLKYYIDTYGNT